MTDARDTILRRLRLQTRGDVAHPPVWETRNQFDDLATRYAESLTAVEGSSQPFGRVESGLNGRRNSLAEQRIDPMGLSNQD